MVEGEIATAAKDAPRFAAGGPAARSPPGGAAAARLARRGGAARYSRFEAEVRASKTV